MRRRLAERSEPGVAGEYGIMNTLVILNDPPYGTERSYNALRLAETLLKQNAGMQLSIFLMADAVAAARKGQRTAPGFYNVEHMLSRLLASRARVLVCGTDMDARAVEESELIEGARKSSVDDLARTVRAADKVLVF